MERRKFIVGAGALAAGSAAAVGTGAFTSVKANRDITVAVSKDADALLAMEPTDHPNGAYAFKTDATTNDRHDVIGIEINSNNPSHDDNVADGNFSGDGVNENSVTEIRHIVKITNQGTQVVELYVKGIGQQSNGNLNLLPVANENSADTIDDSQYFSGTYLDSSPYPVLAPGESIDLGLVINNSLTDFDGQDTIKIHADAVSTTQ